MADHVTETALPLPPPQLLPHLWTTLMLTLLVTLLAISLLHRGLATYRKESQQMAADSFVLTQPLLLDSSEDTGSDDWHMYVEGGCKLGRQGNPAIACRQHRQRCCRARLQRWRAVR
jgi:hypothetical protein